MQPTGYGAPEIHQQHHPHHQLMDDDCCSPVFSISNPQNQTQQHHFYQLLPSQQQKQQPPQHVFSQPPPQHSLPMSTQQLFHHQNKHFQAFNQNERLLHQPHQQQSCNNVSDPCLDMNFKLGLDGRNRADFLLGNDQNISGFQQRSLVMPPHCWRSQEDSAAIKQQRFWCNSKQSNEEDKGQQEIECNKQQQVDRSNNNEICNKSLESKYRLYGELEAIYNLSKIVETNQLQTGSGSALTGENSPKACVDLSMPSRDDVQCKNVVETGGGVNNNAIGVDNGSENSIGEEALLMKIQKKKRKRKVKEKLGSMVGFFESLVKQVMDHQEGLHRKFLDVIEKMDRERTEREEAWRRQESAKYNREAVARGHEQTLASNRESLIISHIEKITGQNINLPPRKSTLLLQPQLEVTKLEPIKDMKIDTNSRWPKAEVEALIQVRSGLESRFLEPGLKGPLWDEVSSLMGSLGYQRSAKRCKEKWENINKYFRKTKESGKKRSLQSKTCAYFDHLDQLYSRTPLNYFPSCSSNNPPSSFSQEGYTELLEAFVGGQNTSSTGNFNVSEMGSSRLDFDGIGNEKVEFEQGRYDNEQENQVGDEEQEKTDDSEEEGD
ncbi:hypothetical protein LWI29_022586 [Acer saccharum]|uniref:Myb-like domain-containing protein n=1 Tax=Acer saccharum TaxID=4024 RepID=A0AA39RFN5_ACESA|nr:hypothetical protein LWI29_022586 [Acer saccharum]